MELLLARTPLPPLFPKMIYRLDLRSEIEQSIIDPLYKAALHLWNDDLALCHEIAQRNENPDGNLLHSILHRRERQWDNSLYWSNRVDKHPVWDRLAKSVPGFSPQSFVEWSRKPTKPEAELEKIQSLEMRYVLEHLV